MTATHRGPVIDTTGQEAPEKAEWSDGHVWPRGAPRDEPRPAPPPEDEDEVDEGAGWSNHWGWGPLWGRVTRSPGVWRWRAEEPPAERDEDEVEHWAWTLGRAVGCTLLGVPLGAWRAAMWVSDERGAAAERETHRAVPVAARGYHLGFHDHHHLGAVLSHHRDERQLHLHRIWFRCAVSVALAVGVAAGWWWAVRHLGAPARCAILGVLALGAVCGAHHLGALWLARRTDGDEWGDPTGVPPAVDMPSPPRDQPRQAGPPTDSVLLAGVRGAFISGDRVLPTAEIIARCRNGGGWWAQVSVREMGMRLAALGLRSVNTNMRGEHGLNPKGFRLADVISALAPRTPGAHDE